LAEHLSAEFVHPTCCSRGHPQQGFSSSQLRRRGPYHCDGHVCAPREPVQVRIHGVVSTNVVCRGDCNCTDVRLSLLGTDRDHISSILSSRGRRRRCTATFSRSRSTFITKTLVSILPGSPRSRRCSGGAPRLVSTTTGRVSGGGRIGIVLFDVSSLDLIPRLDLN
jgi:hypothetical protein